MQITSAKAQEVKAKGQAIVFWDAGFLNPCWMVGKPTIASANIAKPVVNQGFSDVM